MAAGSSTVTLKLPTVMDTEDNQPSGMVTATIAAGHRLRSCPGPRQQCHRQVQDDDMPIVTAYPLPPMALAATVNEGDSGDNAPRYPLHFVLNLSTPLRKP